MDKKLVYSRLKGWLVENSISQADVAKKLGTTSNMVNKKLNGTGSDFRLSEARLLHEQLNVPMAYFFEVNVPKKELKK